MALTSWTPTGALSKITQFTMGAIDRANPATNLIPAGMTAEISSNASNLLSDIKPGYMLGAKPRQQAIGHVIGIFAGTLACGAAVLPAVPAAGAERRALAATIVSEQFAMPAALQWKGVADLITKGLSHAADVGGDLDDRRGRPRGGVRGPAHRTKGRFPLSAVSIGLGVVLPPEPCFAMWVGAMIFWYRAGSKPAPGTRAHAIWVDGFESICAGLISGAALVGIGNAIVNVLMN